jgi:hypothetical protein
MLGVVQVMSDLDLNENPSKLKRIVREIRTALILNRYCPFEK